MKTTQHITVLILASVVLCHADTTTGLVGEWLFNGNTNDTSGYGSNGVATGASLTLDRFSAANRSYDFNGVDQWIEVPDAPSLRVMSNWTLSAWVRPETLTSPYLERIIDKGGDDFSGNPGYMLGYNADRNFTFASSWGGGGEGQVISTTQVNASEWIFLTGTYDGTTARLYVNGLLESSAPMNWTITSTKPVQFGRFQGNSTPPNYTSLFNGQIDDVRIYNRALSPSDVTELKAVPEPASLILSAIGIGVFSARRARRRNALTETK